MECLSPILHASCKLLLFCQAVRELMYLQLKAVTVTKGRNAGERTFKIIEVGRKGYSSCFAVQKKIIISPLTMTKCTNSTEGLTPNCHGCPPCALPRRSGQPSAIQYNVRQSHRATHRRSLIAAPHASLHDWGNKCTRRINCRTLMGFGVVLVCCCYICHPAIIQTGTTRQMIQVGTIHRM